MASSTTTSAFPLVVAVDDSSAMRVFFEQAVAGLGVDLRTFPSAAAAAACLDTHQPALLFLDIIMPAKDGLTYLQELRLTSLHEKTQTIVVSSKDYAQDRASAKDLGVLEFVAKPITSRQLAELISRYTGARAIDESTRA